MTLVETHSDETDADFRRAVDALLQSLVPERPGWWHPYDVRGTYECRGIRFREFYCIAGSVEAHLWSIAAKGGPRRLIVFPDESVRVFGPVKIWGRGEEVVIAAEEVRAVG
jgi:hypothetical protein